WDNMRGDCYRRLARRAVTDNQFALAAADRDHRVDRYDAGLDRLADALPFDDARGDFFEGIKGFGLDRALVVQWLADRVHNASEKRFPNRDLQKFSRSFRFVSFSDFCGIAEQNRADFGLFQVQSEAEHAVRELDHLVEHDVAQTFDAGDPVPGFADNADITLGRRCF